MLSHCLKCRKNTESKNTKVVKTKIGRIMLLSKCAVCNSKTSKVIKEQEASVSISSLGIKTSLTLFRMDLFRASHLLGRGGGVGGEGGRGVQKKKPSLKFVTHIPQ